MAVKQKLYYNVQLDGASGSGGTLIKFGAAAGAPGPRAIRFTDSSGNFGNNADLDRYGNLLDPNQFAGASGNGAKTRQAIGAWFAPGSYSAGMVRVTTLAIDFIPEKGLSTAAAIATAPSIDPSTQRRPRVRLALTPVGADFGAGSTVAGVLYIQRQHSIEV